MKFRNIYKNSEARVEDCLLSLWVPGNHPMRPAIIDLFKREPFIGEPFFQSAFGWEQIPNGCNWKNGFDSTVATMIEKIGTKNHTRPWKPYVHQKESWDILNNTTPGQAQSIVVTSGTGSGKTECFLYPVLNDMFNHSGEGIQAIFLYPLNALANDQKGRIEKCCEELGLQFACYNRSTKYAGQYHSNDTEIAFRTAIREHRPDLLLSNPSMLEYILVRDEDQPVMHPNNPEQKTSSLRWIVIDEAHTYTGSSAVELKYEIKRIIEAFGAKMEDIHFACTSATIGSNPKDLQQFIHELTGQDIDRIHVIGGRRIVTPVDITTVDALLKPTKLTVAASDVLDLRQRLNDKPFLSASEIWNVLFKGRPFITDCIPELLKTLDTLCDICWTVGNTQEFLLMMRAHFFMREPGGLFACLNPNCSHHGDSPLGFITSLDSQTCPHCGAPLFELCECRSCQEFMYLAEEDPATHEVRAIRSRDLNDAADNIFTEEDDDDNSSQSATINAVGTGMPIPFKASLTSLSNPRHSHLRAIYHDLDFTGKKVKRCNSRTPSTYITYMTDTHAECCTKCGQLTSSNKVAGFHLPMDTLKQLVSPALLTESTPNPGQFWGKYISFTDSRQKTAISAKKFNINVERDFALARILEHLTEDHISNKTIRPIKLSEFKDKVCSKDIFEHIATDLNTLDSYKAAVLRSAIGRRLLLASGSLETMGLISVVYPDLASKYRPSDVTKWNNAHPGAPEITENDWRDFLKICLDYLIRLENCIQPLDRLSAPNERDYLRNNSPTKIAAAGTVVGQGIGKVWPSIKYESSQLGNAVKKQNRIVTLLCAALGIDDEVQLSNPSNKQAVTNILDAAWKQLTGLDGSIPVLSTDDGGISYYLDMSTDNPYMSKCMLKLNESSYICPVSQKFLDVTFMGYSPMMNGQLIRSNMEQYKCDPAKVKMPLLTISQPSDSQIAKWLDNCQEVINLKAMGLWSNYLEGAFRFKKVYVAAEHSAQLERSLLEKYTNQFKGTQGTPGRLNILNCSTTMEMGVDIGDIDMVFLANVPPESANYLQRAGRAGRFGQSKSAAFTTCPCTPDGLKTFFTPDIMLQDTTAKRMPKESKVIVERHINAFFFRSFVLRGGMTVSGDSSAADFFISSQPGIPSTCDDFVSHLRGLGQSLSTVFNGLFPPSTGFTYASALNRTVQVIISIAADFVKVHRELVNAYKAATTAAAQVAISYQLNKFADQNLIGYLSEMQFFPNASMPTGIVEFDATSKRQRELVTRLVSEIKILRVQINQIHSQVHSNPQLLDSLVNIQKELGQKKEKLKSLKRGTIVTREARVALNEYAPGQTVVINEKNYVSYALADRSTYGNKSMAKYISHCDTCGWVEYSPSSPGTAPRICPHCGNGNMTSVGLRDSSSNTFFSLAKDAVGYTADYYGDEDRHEDNAKHFYAISSFLPDFDWLNSHQVGLCDIKGKEKGVVVYCNKGAGFGFAIQKESTAGFPGRAVLDVGYSAKPDISGKGIRWSSHSPYESNQVYRHVLLTCENTTSYAAIRFYNDARRTLQISTEAFLYSMGVILTKALCECLAIDSNEVAFGVNRVDASNYLYIYDTNKGGAGYSTQLQDPAVFESVIKTAYAIVSGFTCDCKYHPGQACAKCLMDRGTYSYAGLLSTADVYDWLTLEMKQFKTVPANILSLSPSCRYEPRTLIEILNDAVDNNSIQTIEIFIPKENELIPADWNDSNSQLGNLFRKAQSVGKVLNLYLEYDKNDNDIASVFSIYNSATALSWFNNVSTVEFSGTVRSAIVLKGIAGDIQHYFTPVFDSLPLSNLWSTECDELYQDSEYPAMSSLNLPTAADIQAQFAGGKRSIVDGFIKDSTYSSDTIFRDILLPQVIKGDAQLIHGIETVLNNQLVTVEFTENYLVNPISCIILTGLIKEIKDRYHLSIDKIVLNLDNACCKNSNIYIPISNQYIRYNFDKQENRDAYITDLMQKELHITPSIHVNRIDHHRWLRFTVASGKFLEIRPEHGIGAGWENNTLKHKDLAYLSLPINFKKIRKTGEPEPSIVYYLVLDKN